MKLKPLHRRNLIKKIKKLWFKWPLVWGNHEYLINDDWFKIFIPNAHSWKDIPIPLLKAIIKQLGITLEKFLDL